jgi:hypothetical protein
LGSPEIRPLRACELNKAKDYPFQFVIPANAGMTRRIEIISSAQSYNCNYNQIPAFAGMTKWWKARQYIAPPQLFS